MTRSFSVPGHYAQRQQGYQEQKQQRQRQRQPKQQRQQPQKDTTAARGASKSQSCAVRCMNGGSCTGKRCRCVIGFQGPYCGQRKLQSFSEIRLVKNHGLDSATYP